jgi:hypothetical protein
VSSLTVFDVATVEGRSPEATRVVVAGPDGLSYAVVGAVPSEIA